MIEDQIRAEARKVFEKHELKIVENTDHIQMFICRKPNDSTFAFQVVCANNMVCLTGDIYSMLVEPGYGRNGTMFLRGSINSEGYFLGKIRLGRDDHTKYSVEEAQRIIDNEREQYKDSPEVLDQLDDILIGDEGKYGEFKFYESWYDAGLDECPNPKVLTAQTIYQLEGLKWLANKLDEINFEIGVTK